MSEPYTTTDTIWQLAKKYADGDYQIFLESDEVERIREHKSHLMVARPWRDDLIVLKVTTTTTTQEIL